MYELGVYQSAILAIGSIFAGLVLLMRGGDWTVEVAVWIAEKAGLSKLFIGATIVAFGTSVPELFTTVNANLSGFPGLALGNVIGSNIANILLIVGATAIIFNIKGKPSELLKDVVMVTLASAVFVFLVTQGVIARWHGLLMFAALVVYVAYQFRADKGSAAVELDEVPAPALGSFPKALAMLAGGLLALAVGSELLVQGAVAAGGVIGVPEAVIGLTVVAFGTSLPELATCVAAAAKRHTNMLIGNILGSNLFNILSIVGITAMVKPIVIHADVADADLWVMLGITILFCAWMLTFARVGRVLGIALVAAYVLFIGGQYQGVIAG